MILNQIKTSRITSNTKEISSEDILGLPETYKLEDIILKLCAIENIQRLKIKVRDSALDGSSNIIKRCENTISKQKTLIESLERTNKLASVLLQYNTLRTDKLKSRIKVLGFALVVVVGFALVLAFKAFL